MKCVYCHHSQDTRTTSVSIHRLLSDTVVQVQGLRGLVEQPSDDEELEEDHIGGCNGTANGYDRPDSRTAVGPLGFRLLLGCGVSWQPPTTLCSRLCEVYLQRVDPLMKILHRPSLTKFMMDEECYLGYRAGHPASAALRSAVCYAAVCSMDEELLQSSFGSFGSSKKEVLTSYRSVCECALEKAQLVNTRDITVLQAFVLYLVSVIACFRRNVARQSDRRILHSLLSGSYTHSRSKSHCLDITAGGYPDRACLVS